MKLLLLMALLFAGMATTTLCAKEKKYEPSVVPKHMSVAEKKKRFFALLVPPVKHVHRELEREYEAVKQDIQNHTNQAKITALKKKYNAKTDEDLLIAIKPHPMSIALAQAAMESAWGTSRFFREANNIFGVRSINPQQPRVAASETKGHNIVWVRKYNNLNQAIRDYYFMISTIPQYKVLKTMNYEGKPSIQMIEGLKEYSERGDAYVKELRSMIRYNKLTKYDTKVAK